jgi:hypothetical protein
MCFLLLAPLLLRLLVWLLLDHGEIVRERQVEPSLELRVAFEGLGLDHERTGDCGGGRASGSLTMVSA